MDFADRKLPLQVAETMRLCPVNSVHPYAPMLAPVYVFLRLNAKFVSVKSPLDFFTPEELKRYLPMESFFMPPNIGAAIPFVETGRKIRTLLSWAPRPVKNVESLPPSPYELSDAILQSIGPLWGTEHFVEPFFMSALATELLPLIPEQHLLDVREQSMELYELSMLRAGCAVFLSLMNGVHHLGHLEKMRNDVFLSASGKYELSGRYVSSDLEIMKLTETLIQDGSSRAIRISDFRDIDNRAALKLLARLQRVTDEPLISEDLQSQSIFGPEGFASYG